MRIGLGICLALAVGGTVAAQPVAVVAPQPIPVSPLASPGATKSISLARAAANLRPGVPWLEHQAWSPLGCSRDFTLKWEASNNEIGKDTGFERSFREELSALGFKVSGDPTNLFESDNKSSDLQVGALINDLRVRFCETHGLSGPVNKGAASMDVEWQIYSVVQAKVVARITTRGGYEIPKLRSTEGAAHLLGGAFADNVRRLGMDPQFRTLVTTADVPTSSSQMASLSVRLPAFRPVALNEAAKGVVSIFAGDGHGSGVLISADGYVLTNHHVAGDGGRVRIRWPDGTDTVGDVVRADRRRDVALIKTTARAQPLAIRRTPATLGETVFAIGTPVDRELAGTLTRGVVSTANRTYEGQSFIQSDVAVTHGNSGGPLLDEKGAVIGLTVIGLYPDQSKSLNLFIPIEDALKVLALQPAS